MLWGHRRDSLAYAHGLNEFDDWLGMALPELRDGDLLMITADHGCDPGDVSTDHTRENVPLLVYGKKMASKDLGMRKTYSDIAASVADWLDISYTCNGTSFVGELN